jgi:hypothetical protein
MTAIVIAVWDRVRSRPLHCHLKLGGPRLLGSGPMGGIAATTTGVLRSITDPKVVS